MMPSKTNIRPLYLQKLGNTITPDPHADAANVIILPLTLPSFKGPNVLAK